MIAEDFRELFGTENARTGDQMNREIPLAADVPGLKDYLASTFRTAASTASASSPAPTPPLAVSGVIMNPQTVTKTGTANFSLSSTATVTVEVRDAAGKVVRTLLNAASRPSGSSSVLWDRNTDSGRRAKTGSYILAVTATSGSGRATATATFTVG
jgi:flagellar hook assembly protein FlgD